MAAKGELRLSDEQRAGSEPSDHIWLAASAGTGKTLVLTSRVQRLLLRDVKPEAILCLTFTKAAAAEMAERIQTRLAEWVRLPENALRKDLFELGEPHRDPVIIARARTLFAKVLDAPGGLRIMTIHGFCQALLAAFPLEAELAPGFRAIEGREQAALQREVFAALLADAERSDPALIDDLRMLSQRMGEERVIAWLRNTTSALPALEALGAGLAPRVYVALDLPSDHTEADIVRDCADGAFARDGLEELAGMYADWGTATGTKASKAIGQWLAGSAEARAAGLLDLLLVWRTAKDRTLRKNGPKRPGFEAALQRVDAWCLALCQKAERGKLATTIVAALRAARAHARAYVDAKAVRGFVDFDDMIARTLALLGQSAMSEWIRYKLDQTTDHILVDEAQDTNAAQWAIVMALAGEYWAGAGAKGDVLRTLFTVGDFKQAIFGFQGTDPDFYKAAHVRFADEAARVGDALQALSLTESFRSAPAVLDVVDAVMDGLGTDAVGVDRFEAHRSAIGGAGQVLLLPPLAKGAGEDLDDAGDEDWLDDAQRVLAQRIARQVRQWLTEHPSLAPGDVMILCRKRGDLAALLVARLIEEGVPVAGIDRLRLGAPLAVQDMLAAVRFVLQPGDDLNLASLLVSPLLGWSQEELFAVAHGRGKRSLWAALPDGSTRNALRDLLATADLMTPGAFLESILSGSLKGRTKLFERLGEEARDPLEELMNAALAFEREGVATLQGFIDWFDGGEAEVKRDPDSAGNAVRVMTVHAAKGLQAPLVILADACANPDNTTERAIRWSIEGLEDALPMFRPRNEECELAETLGAAVSDTDRRARREHWRLLYVAMTRAERMLVVAGALGKRNPVAPPDSWHARMADALAALGAEPCHLEQWGDALRWGAATGLFRRRERETNASGPVERPAWLDLPAPAETRPPRPLAPSSLGKDDTVDPPPGRADGAMAERGRVLHALFERLPSIAPERRREAGLATFGAAAAPLVDAALAVITDPALDHVFVSDALVEVPLAGVVEGIVVAGTVDRLIVREDRVTLIDFKTGRRVPITLDEVPRAHLRQMAAYAAVLAAIYPGRPIESLLLYTEGPTLHSLPQPLLNAHKPGLDIAEQSLPADG